MDGTTAIIVESIAAVVIVTVSYWGGYRNGFKDGEGHLIGLIREMADEHNRTVDDIRAFFHGDVSEIEVSEWEIDGAGWEAGE